MKNIHTSRASARFLIKAAYDQDFYDRTTGHGSVGGRGWTDKTTAEFIRNRMQPTEWTPLQRLIHKVTGLSGALARSKSDYYLHGTGLFDEIVRGSSPLPQYGIRGEPQVETPTKRLPLSSQDTTIPIGASGIKDKYDKLRLDFSEVPKSETAAVSSGGFLARLLQVVKALPKKVTIPAGLLAAGGITAAGAYGLADDTPKSE